MERKKTLLLIDDSLAFCNQVRLAFIDKYNIYTVNEIEKVRTNLKARKYDLILLDLMLGDKPILNGFDLINEIREYNTRIPIVAITVDDSRETTHIALYEHKVNNIIIKHEKSFEELALIIDEEINDNPARSAFISYSRKDRSIFNLIRERLEREHINVVFDEKNITIGGNITEEISDMIMNSDFYVVLLSQQTTKNSLWVKQELDYVIRKKNSYNNIIPLQIENFELPPFFDFHIGSSNILQFWDIQEKFDEINAKLKFNDWLNDYPNPFYELVEALDEKFNKILKVVYPS